MNPPGSSDIMDLPHNYNTVLLWHIKDAILRSNSQDHIRLPPFDNNASTLPILGPGGGWNKNMVCNKKVWGILAPNAIDRDWACV